MRHWLFCCECLSLVTLTTCGVLVAASAHAQERPPGAEAVSLLGEPLFPTPLAADTRSRLEANLASARAAHDRDSSDPEATIWLGRRTAYLGRYRDAIGIYSRGIAQHSDNAKLYRHRGHRFISTRQLDLAIRDLQKATELIESLPDEVEPDGQPNERNIPTSTSHTNIWYHLELAYYLSNDLERARDAYRECLKFSKNPDMLVATSHWLYMTLRRLGQETEAAELLQPIQEDMDIIENGAYHRLLMMYKGLIPPEVLLERAQMSGGIEMPTLGYGIANWHLYNDRAREGFRVLRLIQAGDQWAAFGFIAAEADLARSAESRR